MRVFRVIAILIGLVLTAFGLLTLVSTVAGLALVGFDNKVDTGDTTFRSKTAAIAAEADGLGDDAERFWGEDDKANVKVDASSDNDKELFLGVGPTDKVKEYLDQAPWDQVDALTAGRFSTSVDDVDYTREGRSGRIRQLPAPTGENFWTTSKTGTKVNLDWDFEQDDHMVVLMNADGSPAVRADGTVEVKIPRLSVALIAGAVIGLILFLLGLLFLFKVGRRRREPTATGYPIGGDPRPSPT